MFNRYNMHEISLYITQIVENFGYFGIFAMMMIESTVLPLPSEIVMIPAGYLCYAGKMNIVLASLCGGLGSLVGSWINYAIAYKFGRGFVIKYGKYFLFPEQKFYKIERFFNKYGAVSTFIGRFLPVVRHFISIPAGLCKMPLKTFAGLTFAGAFLWSLVLVLFGYFIGSNIELFKFYAHLFNAILIASILLFVGYKIYVKR